MPRYYLEIEFEQDEEAIEDGAPQEIIRIQVNDETEAKTLYDQLKPTISNRKHRAYIHVCYHSKEGNAPCERIPIL